MKLLRRSTPLAPTLCLMKMLRIWRPTSSSDAISYVRCGYRTDDHRNSSRPQAAEWTYTVSVARRRGEDPIGENGTEHPDREIAAHGLEAEMLLSGEIERHPGGPAEPGEEIEEI